MRRITTVTAKLTRTLLTNDSLRTSERKGYPSDIDITALGIISPPSKSYPYSLMARWLMPRK